MTPTSTNHPIKKKKTKRPRPRYRFLSAKLFVTGTPVDRAFNTQTVHEKFLIKETQP